MKRKLFCEISPFTYRLSMEKEILKRHLKDLFQGTHFAKERSESTLIIEVIKENSSKLTKLQEAIDELLSATSVS